jgi:hypothetical protein
MLDELDEPMGKLLPNHLSKSKIYIPLVSPLYSTTSHFFEPWVKRHFFIAMNMKNMFKDH